MDSSSARRRTHSWRGLVVVLAGWGGYLIVETLAQTSLLVDVARIGLGAAVAVGLGITIYDFRSRESSS